MKRVILVVRGNTALIVRLICSLALIVAAMPVKAGEAPCASPAPAPAAASVPVRRMPCCEDEPPPRIMPGKERAAVLACCGAKTRLRAQGPSRHQLAEAPDPCPCEIKAAPSAPVAEVKAIVSGFDPHAPAALPPPSLPGLPAPVEIAEPGIFGADSGPPPGAGHLSDFGRAPPVARA